MAEILVPDNDARDQYTASASQTVFPYTFPIFDQGDLVVQQTLTTGVTTTLVITTDYTVSGVGVVTGGNITLVSGAAVNDIITIERDVPIARTTDFQVAGDYRAETINSELDNQVMMMQQNERDIGRSLKLASEDTSADMTLPIDRASKFLAFDTAGEPVASDIAVGTIASSIISDVVAMRAATVTNGEAVYLESHTLAGDGGDGHFRGVTGAAPATYSDNNGTIIVPSGGDGSAAWLRETSNESTFVNWFGASGDGSDEQAKIQAAIDYSESVRGRRVYLDPNREYSIGSKLIVGAASKTILDGISRRGKGLKALTAFTGGLVQILDGGCHQLSGTGAGVNTSGHYFITYGSAVITNPPVDIQGLQNRGGFFDFIFSIYECDNAKIKDILSLLEVGHSVIDTQVTLGGGVSFSMSPQITGLFIRNPITTRAVGDPVRYGVLLANVESAVITGQISNFDINLDIEDGCRETDINDLLILDLRETANPGLFDTEWVALTVKNLGDHVKPTITEAVGHFYEVTTGGTTGAAEPTWPTGFNATVVDGTVTWTEVGQSIGVKNWSAAQTSIRNTRIEDTMCAVINRGNGNLHITDSRISGSTASFMHHSGSNAELYAVNNTFIGDFRLSTPLGAVFTRMSGANNNITGDSVGEVPDHESSVYSPTILFPATQIPNADANALDDYAEGEFTIAIVPATSGTVTVLAAADAAAYTKIGRVVHIQGFCTIDAVNAPVGDARITLPFPVGALTESAELSVGPVLFDNVDYVSTGWVVCSTGPAGTSYMVLQGVSDAAAKINEDADIFSAGDKFGFQLTYFTD